MQTKADLVLDGFRNKGLEITTVKTGQNGLVAFLPKYGRVIGLWTDTSLDNAMWTNPGQESVGWANPGGDRLWLSPERDFFIEDLNNIDGTYCVPACIDPGSYIIDVLSDSVMLHNSGVIKAHSAGLMIPFETSRHIKPLANINVDDGVNAAGYEETTTLTLTQNSPMKISYWNLVQVPQSGIVYAGTVDGACFVKYFGEPAGAVSGVSNGLAEISFAGSSEFKVGYTSSDACGLIGYLRKNPGSELSTLLIRTFNVDQQAEYVDFPWEGNTSEACAVQFFYGADNYRFGELEYHSPATDSQVTGTSSIVCYTGSYDKILQIIKDIRRAI